MRSTGVVAGLVVATLHALGPAAGWTIAGQQGERGVTVPSEEIISIDAEEFGGTLIELTVARASGETFRVGQGDAVRLVVSARVETELHLHGYDIVGTAGPDGPAVLTFIAIHSGRFAIEAHGNTDLLGRRHKAIAYIEVRPE